MPLAVALVHKANSYVLVAFIIISVLVTSSGIIHWLGLLLSLFCKLYKKSLSQLYIMAVELWIHYLIQSVYEIIMQWVSELLHKRFRVTCLVWSPLEFNLLKSVFFFFLLKSIYSLLSSGFNRCVSELLEICIEMHINVLTVRYS